jgi:hypothetical protein
MGNLGGIERVRGRGALANELIVRQCSGGEVLHVIALARFARCGLGTPQAPQATMPMPGAAKSVVPKNGIGIARLGTT